MSVSALLQTDVRTHRKTPNNDVVAVCSKWHFVAQFKSVRSAEAVLS